MKKLMILAATMFAAVMSAQEDNRVLLTINGVPSTVDEFMYIYNKNNQEAQLDQKTIDEYLDLFINFKLKVTEAESQGLDTTEAFKKELDGYRRQATPKYMLDEEAQEAMIRRCYDRMSVDRMVRHIAVQCPATATPEEEAEALAKINYARQRVTTGVPVTTGKGKKAKTVQGPVEDFITVALETSTDPNVAETKGYVGCVTPFRYVYSFEQATYNTPVGGISEIFRTPYGFHFLRVEEEVPHIEVHAQHIMKMTPRNNDSITAVAKEEIDSIYMLVAALGRDFSEVAMEASDDRGSSKRGGDLGWFGRGMMVKEFEDATFAMTEEGEICMPVKSKYGYHIIKYLGRRNLPPYEEMHDEILKKIKQDERQQEVNDAFIAKLKKEYNYTPVEGALDEFIALGKQYGDIHDSLFQVDAAKLEGDLFVIGGQGVSKNEFAKYMATNTWSKLTEVDAVINEKYDLLVARELRKMEDSNLEKKYPDLRNLITEYHDGILLFDVSLKEVWDKASLDTAGITKFFKENQKSYAWDKPHYKGWVVSCKDKASMTAAKQIIKNANADSVSSYINKRVNVDSIPAVKIQHGLWEAGQNLDVDRLGLKLKAAKKDTTTVDAAYPYVFVSGKKLNCPEVYTDERSKVTSAYQDYLEKAWVKSLREKYEVVVDQEVLNSLRK